MTKYKSHALRWNQRTKHKQLFVNGRGFKHLGVVLTKSDVIHAHQYGYLPEKKSKLVETKSKKYNFKSSKDRAEFKKKHLQQIEYNPKTGEFKRDGDIIKSEPCLSGYLYVNAGNIKLSAHRLAYLITHDEWPEHVDHINRDAQDNRADNLRAATCKQNNQNRGSRKNSTSKHKGVSWSKEKGKWDARCNKKFLGRFNNEKEAAQAYNKEAKKQYGEFAYINKT